MDEARRRIVFTTHTPVAAGNESYRVDEAGVVLGKLFAEMGADREQMLGLGRIHPGDPGDSLGMTVLGLRASRSANAVSRRHGEVARSMWQPLYPGTAEQEVPIGHVTNGVHLPTWMAPPMRQLLDRHLGSDWMENPGDPGTWERIDAIPDQELWETRSRLRADLVRWLRERAVMDRLAREEPSSYVEAATEAFDPDALTLGFARRVAAYKRLDLLIREPERVAGLLSGPDPVQVVLAGKAHPQDDEAKKKLQHLFEMKWTAQVGSRVAYVEDYDMAVAAHLVSGCDVWINLPRPPLEASGTSGMKAALNGALNLSILDGWWMEAWDGHDGNGWGIDGSDPTDPEGEDQHDAAAFYDLVEREVIPLYFDRDENGVPTRWVQHIKASLKAVGSRFTATRMVSDYLAGPYRPD